MKRPRLIACLIAAFLLCLPWLPYKDMRPAEARPETRSVPAVLRRHVAVNPGYTPKWPCLPHIAETYKHTGRWGIFIRNAGCYSIKEQVIIYRNPTTVAGALWWGPCATHGLPLICEYMLTAGLYRLRTVLTEIASSLPAWERHCWYVDCISFDTYHNFVDAEYDKQTDLINWMYRADAPFWWHYCIALQLPDKWTVIEKGVDGCRRGY